MNNSLATEGAGKATKARRIVGLLALLLVIGTLVASEWKGKDGQVEHEMAIASSQPESSESDNFNAKELGDIKIETPDQMDLTQEDAVKGAHSGDMNTLSILVKQQDDLAEAHFGFKADIVDADALHVHLGRDCLQWKKVSVAWMRKCRRTPRRGSRRFLRRYYCARAHGFRMVTHFCFSVQHRRPKSWMLASAEMWLNYAFRDLNRYYNGQSGVSAGVKSVARRQVCYYNNMGHFYRFVQCMMKRKNARCKARADHFWVAAQRCKA